MYSQNSLNALRFIPFCLSLVLLLSVQGCNDDDDPKDSTLPEIAFANLTPDMEVWNTLSFSLNASDDFGLSTVEVFVDDELVTTLTAAPFETSWDSNLVPDGAHTLKAVATDKSGNTTEAKVTIHVKNALLTIDIPADQLQTFDGAVQRGFVFLSDENGNVIASTEYTNGNEVTLKSPSFNGGTFFLTEVLADFEGGAFTYVSAWTWAAIERGNSWVVYNDLDSDDEVEYVGEAEISFENAVPESNYSGSTNGGQFDVYGSPIAVQLLKSPSQLFVVKQPWSGDPFQYGLFSDIVPGPNTVSLFLVYNPFEKITAAIPADAHEFFIEVYGYPEVGDYSEPYYVGHTATGSADNTIDIFYPGTAFPSYFSHIVMETPDMYYSRGINAGIVNLDIPETNVDMSFADSKLNYSSSGNFDFMTIHFRDETERFRWTYVLPKGDDHVVPAMTIPNGMEALALPAFDLPKSYVIYDFDATSNYDDLKAFVRSSTGGMYGLYEDGANYLDIEYLVPSAGGRLKNRTMRQHGLKAPGRK